jgi:hypothetical protein
MTALPANLLIIEKLGVLGWRWTGGQEVGRDLKSLSLFLPGLISKQRALVDFCGKTLSPNYFRRANLVGGLLLSWQDYRLTGYESFDVI